MAVAEERIEDALCASFGKSSRLNLSHGEILEISPAIQGITHRPCAGVSRRSVLGCMAYCQHQLDELIAACTDWPSATVLHGTGMTIDGVNFFGIGGGIPVTPFGSWSYDFTEAQAVELLADCPQGCVLVSHSPPKGAVDLSSRGDSIDSTAIRDVIERVRPALVVCGHVHASPGRQAMIGETAVVNAGPTGVMWMLAGRSHPH